MTLILKKQTESGYLHYVIVKLFQRFLAVDESVAGAFSQFHQEVFVCCQELTATV